MTGVRDFDLQSCGNQLARFPVVALCTLPYANVGPNGEDNTNRAVNKKQLPGPDPVAERHNTCIDLYLGNSVLLSMPKACHITRNSKSGALIHLYTCEVQFGNSRIYTNMCATMTFS